MRLRDHLNRRYTMRQSIVLMLPTVVVLLAVQTGAVAIGISRPVAATISLAAGLGVLFVLAAFIDRRTRRS